jgi:hypothetical protein
MRYRIMDENKISKGILNSNHLKLIAIIVMTIDHATDLFFPGFPIKAFPIGLHILGRLAAPIMWFFVCEGFYYTRDVKKYMLRMFIFAVVSHFAYCFAFGINPIPLSTGIFNQTSVMWPLFIAVLVLWLKFKVDNIEKWKKDLIMFGLIMSAFPADWSSIAVLAIVGMYKQRGNVKGQMLKIIQCVFLYALVSFFFVSKGYALVQIGILLVYPVLKLYNGERGKIKWMRWLFYVYYPLHLIIIGLIRVYGFHLGSIIF